MPKPYRSRGLRPRAFFAFLILVAMFWGGALSSAFGTFASITSSSMSVSSAILVEPTGLGAANQNCVISLSREVKLTWTATTSTFADGYQIFRSVTNGGPYTSQGTVAGRTTLTFTDSTILPSTTYYYVVQSTKNNWRSVNSTQVSITTPSLICT